MKKTLVVDNERDVKSVANVCGAMFAGRGPLEVIIQDLDNSRSTAQNRLAFLWYGAASEQIGDKTKEGERAFCKLHFGVPIRREEEDFREVYDRVIRPLTYEQKIEIMAGVIDFPVTRDMKTKQMARYLEAVEEHYTSQFVDLPKPEELYLKSMGRKQ